jgi:hypothetical protein
MASGIIDKTLEDLIFPLTNSPTRLGIMAISTSIDGIDTDSIFKEIETAVKSKKYNIIVAPEYTFLSQKGPFSKQELESYFDRLKELSKEGTLIIPGTFVWYQNKNMYNSCFIFYNGKVVHRYDKNHSTHEKDIARKFDLNFEERFSLGTLREDGITEGIFNVGNLGFGIEICTDVGILRRTNYECLDAIFLVSRGCIIENLNYAMHAVKKRGYGIIADGYHNMFDIRQKS